MISVAKFLLVGGFLCVIVGFLTLNIKRLEETVVGILRRINKVEMKN